MKTLPAENIRISGEFYARTLKNYSRLHDLWYRPGIIGRPPACSEGWPGDWDGRTILALAMHADALHTTPAFLDDIVLDIRGRCNERGYIGPVVKETAINEQVYPSHSWLLRGLIEYYRLTDHKWVLDWIGELLDNLFLPLLPHLAYYPRTKAERAAEKDGEAVGAIDARHGEWLLSSDIGCVLIALDGISAAYELTGRDDLMPLIDELIAVFDTTDYVENRLQTHASLTYTRGLLRMWKLTGDAGLLDRARGMFDDYKRFGMTAYYANFNWFMRPSWSEPCAVIDSYIVAFQLWQATEDARYLEDAQMILYNGFFRGQRPNGGFGCDGTGEDCFLAVRKETYEARWCCTMRAGEGFGFIARNAAFDENGTLLFPLLTDVTVDTNEVCVRLKSSYPALGSVSLNILRGDGHVKRIGLYLPRRAKDPSVAINCKKIPFEEKDGFVLFNLPAEAGAQADYTFELSLHTETVDSAVYDTAGRYLILYGPQILSADETAPDTLKTEDFSRIGTDRWQADGITLKPISVAYLMEKEELMSERRRILFGGGK